MGGCLGESHHKCEAAAPAGRGPVRPGAPEDGGLGTWRLGTYRGTPGRWAEVRVGGSCVPPVFAWNSDLIAPLAGEAQRHNHSLQWVGLMSLCLIEYTGSDLSSTTTWTVQDSGHRLLGIWNVVSATEELTFKLYFSGPSNDIVVRGADLLGSQISACDFWLPSNLTTDSLLLTGRLPDKHRWLTNAYFVCYIL